MPDIAGIMYGQAVFLEVKLNKTATTKKTYLKPHQKEKIAELERAGATCGVVRSVKEAEILINFISESRAILANHFDTEDQKYTRELVKKFMKTTSDISNSV